MKKYFNTRIAIAIAGIATLFAGCADADQVFDQIQADVTRGAVLRGIEITSGELAINTVDGGILDGESFGIIIQEQDQEGGALLSAVEVYVGYDDNTDGATDSSKAEVLFETLPASAFATDELGLPRYDFSVTAAAMQAAIGLTDAEIAGGDAFTVRFELILTDGRKFSVANNSGTITGSFFSSPFLYNVFVVCPPIAPTPGTWTIVQNDSYGDSWNGASIDVTLDGETTSYAHPDGSTTTFEFVVPDGTAEIQIVYVSGDWDGENTYTVTSANGLVVLADGPTPLAGTALFDFCLPLDL